MSNITCALSKCAAFSLSGIQRLAPLYLNRATVTAVAINVLIDSVGRALNEDHLVGPIEKRERVQKLSIPYIIAGIKFSIYFNFALFNIFRPIFKKCNSTNLEFSGKSSQVFISFLTVLTVGNIFFSIFNARNKIFKALDSFKNDDPTYIEWYLKIGNGFGYINMSSKFEETLISQVVSNITSANQTSCYQFLKKNHPDLIRKNASSFFWAFIESNNLEEAKTLYKFNEPSSGEKVKNELSTPKLFDNFLYKWTILNYDSFLFLLEINSHTLDAKSSEKTTFIELLFNGCWVPADCYSFRRDQFEEKINEVTFKIMRLLLEEYPNKIEPLLPKITDISVSTPPDILHNFFDLGYDFRVYNIYQSLIYVLIDGLVDLDNFRQFIDIMFQKNPEQLSELLNKRDDKGLAITRIITNNLNSDEVLEADKNKLHGLHDFLVEKGAPSGFSPLAKKAN
ncbi:MAG: hypothetical protein SNF33_01035 [Candidatus Algichlamydia australiensis]|nr:hypothetical protein [Chlamydiales bacterium]